MRVGARDFKFPDLVLPKAGEYTVAFDGELKRGSMVSVVKTFTVLGSPVMQAPVLER